MEMASDLDPRYRLIADARLSDLLEVWQMTHITPYARDLMSRILRPNPEERLTVAQIKEHPWVAGS